MHKVEVKIPGAQAQNVAGRWVEANVIENRTDGMIVEVPSWRGQRGNKRIFLRNKFIRGLTNPSIPRIIES